MKAFLRPTLLGAALLALALAGCSGSPAAPATSPAVTAPTASATATATSPATPATSAASATSATPSASPTAEGRVIEVTLAGGKVTPNGAKLDAKVGEVITFVINSDHDDEIHIHGIDIEIPVTAGKTVTKAVTLSQAGSFEVESHHPAKVILILNVR